MDTKRIFTGYVHENTKRTDGCWLVRDIFECEEAKQIARAFKSYTEGGWGPEFKMELSVCIEPTTAYRFDDGEKRKCVGTWLLAWGTPSGKRIPRLCVNFEGNLIDFNEFCAS
jgi:hypothetical protein